MNRLVYVRLQMVRVRIRERLVITDRKNSLTPFIKQVLLSTASHFTEWTLDDVTLAFNPFFLAGAHTSLWTFLGEIKSVLVIVAQ